MTELIMPSDVMERRGGVVVSIKDSAPITTPESTEAGKAVVEILKRPEYDNFRAIALKQAQAQRSSERHKERSRVRMMAFLDKVLSF